MLIYVCMLQHSMHSEMVLQGNCASSLSNSLHSQTGTALAAQQNRCLSDAAKKSFRVCKTQSWPKLWEQM